MPTAPRVLVVDELTDTAEVLRAVLEPRGMRVEWAEGPCAAFQTGSNSAAKSVSRLSLVVVDGETAARRGLTDAAWQHVPTVVIGRVEAPSVANPPAGRRYVGKPFQYAELVGAIEALIAEKAA